LRRHVLALASLSLLLSCASGKPKVPARAASADPNHMTSFGDRRELACMAQNEAMACFDAGKYFQTTDSTRARVNYNRACALGQLDGCTAAGFMADRAGELAAMIDYYERACQGGEPIACINLGRTMQERGHDEARAQQLIASGDQGQAARCAKGDAYQCWELATDLDEEEDVALRRKRLDLLEQSCKLKSWLGCRDLGVTLMVGNDPTSHARGRIMLEGLCADGVGSACESLALRYTHGEGVAQDKAKATQLHTTACRLDNAIGCYNGCMVAREARDFGSARSLCSRACVLGDEDGCDVTGYMLDHAEGGAEDLFRAALYFERSCEMGSGSGCSNAGTMYERGRGVTKSVDDAIRFYLRACETGNEDEACERARMLAGEDGGSAKAGTSGGGGGGGVGALGIAATGVPECDTYVNTMVKFARCPKVPDEARKSMNEAFEEARKTMNYASATADEKKSAAQSCKIANDALRQALAQMGC
jgi:TPR repeat protein